MNPLALYGVIALLSAVLSGLGTWKVDEWRHAAIEKDRIEQEAKQRIRAADRIDVAAQDHEQDKERIQIAFRTITKEVEHVVEKPVYRNVCLDDAGLRLVQRAVSGAAASSGPAPAVPGPAASH